MIQEIKIWLETRCVRDVQAMSRTAELFTDWSKWATENDVYIGKHKGFSVSLMKLGVKIGRGSRGERCALGIRVKPP